MPKKERQCHILLDGKLLVLRITKGHHTGVFVEQLLAIKQPSTLHASSLVAVKPVLAESSPRSEPHGTAHQTAA